MKPISPPDLQTTKISQCTLTNRIFRNISQKRYYRLVCGCVHKALNNAIEYRELFNGNGPIRLLESTYIYNLIVDSIIKQCFPQRGVLGCAPVDSSAWCTVTLQQSLPPLLINSVGNPPHANLNVPCTPTNSP